MSGYISADYSPAIRYRQTPRAGRTRICGRGVGQGMVAAPLLLPGMAAASALPLHEAIMSMLGTSALYSGLNDVRRKYGILPDLLP